MPSEDLAMEQEEERHEFMDEEQRAAVAILIKMLALPDTKFPLLFCSGAWSLALSKANVFVKWAENVTDLLTFKRFSKDS